MFAARPTPNGRDVMLQAASLRGDRTLSTRNLEFFFKPRRVIGLAKRFGFTVKPIPGDTTVSMRLELAPRSATAG